jgi:hypothetical protein
MAHTDTWNAAFEALPADSDDVSEGADRIRDLKLAVRERMSMDHYMAIAGTDADHGDHSKVTLRVGSAPTQVADKGILYSKDVTAKAELFYIDEDGDEIQITTGGLLNVPTTYLKKTFAEVYSIASGTNTYAAALTPALSAYVTGGHYFITFTNANTSATPTLNIDSQGAVTIKNPGGTALTAGSIAAGHPGILKYDGTDMILLNPKVVASGVAQVQFASLGTAGSTSVAIPLDNTIPQITEGGQITTCTITPKSASSTLYIEFQAQLCTSSESFCMLALFVAGTANALAASISFNGGLPNNPQNPCGGSYSMTAGVTTALVFSIRAGAAAGTTYWNGSTSQLLGGVMSTFIKITEIYP